MTFKLKPLMDRVIVKRIEPETKTSGGIIIPDSAKEKPMEGMIIAVGEGAIVDGKIMPMYIKVGDKILFAKWGGTEVKIEGTDYIILKQDDILAVYN